MSRTLVTGDLVATLDDPAVISDGAVIVEGDRIAEVGPREVLAGHGPFDDVLGGPGTLVMPGFINGHYHSECWTSGGSANTIFELSNLFLGSRTAPVDEEVLELLATYGLIQCLRGGQTATIDAYYGLRDAELFAAEPVLRAYEAVGMRTALAMSLRDQNIYVHQDNATFLSTLPPAIAAEVEASTLGYAWDVDQVFAAHATLMDRWEGRGGRIHLMLAPDWTPACSDDLLQRSRKVADETGSGLTIHVLETRAELMWNLHVSGKPAVRRLADLGVLGEDVSLSHFVWATDEDLEVFYDSGATAVSNSGSNLRLSSGIARVRDILARDGRIAFGTDGISSTDREDYFAELRLASLLQRQPDVFSEHRLDSTKLLRSAGDNGARALGRPGELGRLRVGMLADLQVLKTGRVFFPPGRFAAMDPLDVIVDRADHTDIDSVMINGDVVMRGGAVTSVDEQAILDRIIELGAERLYGRTGPDPRMLELIALMLPDALALYEGWYGSPIQEPASVYNAHRGPAGLPSA